MKKYFILSDVHGRAPIIEEFKKVGFEETNENHKMILLGDYFDRGNENYEVLLFCEEIQNKYGDRVKLIIGNHDEFLKKFIDQVKNSVVGEEVIHNQWDTMLWTVPNNGGAITLRQLFGGVTRLSTYTLAKKKRVERLDCFLSSLLDKYETDEYIFTHAGFDKNGNVDTWNRRQLYEDNNTGKKIIIGHTPIPYLNDPFIKIKKDVLGCGIYAYNEIADNNVYLIDDGTGKNIVVFEEK